MWSHTVVTCIEICWCLITLRIDRKNKKIAVDGSFPNTEIAEGPAGGAALIAFYSALSVVLNRDVNYQNKNHHPVCLAQ